jgi:hypothetical protein
VIDLDKLEALARAAMVSGVNRVSSGEPVGLMNPATALALVAELRAARELVEPARDLHAAVKHGYESSAFHDLEVALAACDEVARPPKAATP